MSGFEVAGIVLGAIPIVLEVFRLAKRVVGSESQEIIRKLTQTLKHTRAMYVVKLQELVSISCRDLPYLRNKYIPRISTTSKERVDRELALMILLLGDNGAQEKIEEYLLIKQSLFIDNVNSFTQCLSETVLAFRGLLPKSIRYLEGMDLLRELTKLPTQRDRMGLRWRFRMVGRIYMRKSDLIRRNEDLIILTNRLNDIVTPIQLPPPVKASTESLVKTFQQAQSSARCLWSELSRLFRGPCHELHATELVLQNVTNDQTVAFNVVLVSTDAQKIQLVLHSGRIPVQRTSGQARTLAPGEIHCTQTIEHLCKVPNPQRLSLALDEAGTLLSATLPVSQPRQSRTAYLDQDITLKTVLANWDQLSLCSKEKLTKKDRTYIAAQIASSFLQLHSTEWASAFFHGDGVRFKVQASTSPNGTVYELQDTKKPFIACVEPNPSTAPGHIHDFQCALTSLAILLLEIYHRKPLHMWVSGPHQEPLPVLAPGSTTTTEASVHRPALARAWFMEAKGEMELGYRDAVSFCITEALASIATWSEESFCRRFVASVIEPLVENRAGS